jgi:hypothetical protein
MPRLPGTEEWSPQDISDTVEFFLGCAENAVALQRELGPPFQSEAPRKFPSASPMEPYTRAVGLLLATDRTEQALILLREPLRIIRPLTTRQDRYDLSVAEFTRVALFCALARVGTIRVNDEAFEIATEYGYFALVRNRDWHYEMLAVLPVLYVCALALRSEAEVIDRFAKILTSEEDSPGSFVMTESLEFRALGIFQINERAKRSPMVTTTHPLDALMVLRQMENRYDLRLQTYKQDQYHWSLLNTEGDLIDWPLLVTELAAFRVSIDPGLPFVPDTAGGSFIRSLALELYAPSAR